MLGIEEPCPISPPLLLHELSEPAPLVIKPIPATGQCRFNVSDLPSLAAVVSIVHGWIQGVASGLYWGLKGEGQRCRLRLCLLWLLIIHYVHVTLTPNDEGKWKRLPRCPAGVALLLLFRCLPRLAHTLLCFHLLWLGSSWFLSWWGGFCCPAPGSPPHVTSRKFEEKRRNPRPSVSPRSSVMPADPTSVVLPSLPLHGPPHR
ncbi:hypothetical protein GBAR_LOCUS27929, partial [Geodia barretti]